MASADQTSNSLILHRPLESFLNRKTAQNGLGLLGSRTICPLSITRHWIPLLYHRQIHIILKRKHHACNAERDPNIFSLLSTCTPPRALLSPILPSRPQSDRSRRLSCAPSSRYPMCRSTDTPKSPSIKQIQQPVLRTLIFNLDNLDIRCIRRCVRRRCSSAHAPRNRVGRRVLPPRPRHAGDSRPSRL